MADPSTCPPLLRESVQTAHMLIQPLVHKTPVLTCSTLDRIASTPRTAEELAGVGFEAEARTLGAASFASRPRVRLYFKCENLQKVGAFKARGAFHAIERLKQDPSVWAYVREKGVITHSSGNHAAALALAARTAGIPAYIVMPSISPPSKVAATRGYGAEVIFSGSTAPERLKVCQEVQARTGATLVPPYDHPDIVLGQGTMGLELQAQATELMEKRAKIREGTETTKMSFPVKSALDAIITPCSGGGMLAGVALSASQTTAVSPASAESSPIPARSRTLVFAAEPSFQGADDFCRGLRSGTRIAEVKSLTIADGLRTPVGLVPWSLVHDRGLVAGAYSVPERAILATMRLVAERMKIILEPSAAVGLAILLYNEEFRSFLEREMPPRVPVDRMNGRDEEKNIWDIGIIFSGGNCDVTRWVELFGPGSEGEKVPVLL